MTADGATRRSSGAPRPRYAAFISYHRAVDGELAEALQDTLERFAKHWYRRRALRVFRDLTVLAASPDAWAGVRRALDDSEYLILLASPQAAASEWVAREVEYWLATKPASRILIALTAGELAWDRAAGDFDWATTTALPPALRGRLAAEPAWVDLRATRALPKSSRLRAWRVAVAPLAAALHHTTTDQILRDDEREFRRTRRTAIAAAAALTVLTVASLGFGAAAGVLGRRAAEQARLADEQRRVAVSQRLAAEAELISEVYPELSALLTVAAARMDPNELTARAVGAAVSRRGWRVLGGPQPLALLLADRPIQIEPNALDPPQPATHHTGPVRDVAYSRDGRLLATASTDGTARLWNAQSGALVAALDGHGDDVVDLEFSPDGDLLATASADWTARLWSTRTGEAQTTLRGHTGAVVAVAFHPGGQIVATAAADGTARLWSTRTGEQVAVLPGHTPTLAPPLISSPISQRGATEVAFSPTGQIVATAAADGAVHLWDAAATATAQPIETLGGHTRGVTALAFSPDGATLATAGHDTAVRLWDTATGDVRATLTGHTDAVNALAFGPDGSQLATASADGTVRLWNPATARTTATLPGHAGDPNTSIAAGIGARSGASAVAFRPDGDVVATGSGNGTVQLWHAATGRPIATLAGHRSTVTALAFSPDGATLATTSSDSSARLWDATTDLLGHTRSVTAVVFSPDGRMLASASEDETVRLWDPRTRRATAVLTGHSDGVTALAFSPDGSTLATASTDRTVRLWDTASGDSLATLAVHPAAVTAVAFSPDGETVASGDAAGIVRLWDVRSGEHIATAVGHSDDVSTLVFGPDGATVVSASLSDAARLWRVPTLDAVADLSSGAGAHAEVVVYSADASVLAVTDGNDVHLFRPASGERLRTLGGFTAVSAMALSPDGRTVAATQTVILDEVIRLWDVASGEIRADLTGHQRPLSWMAFMPDGQRLVSASREDFTVRLWDIGSARPIAVFGGGSGITPVWASSPDGSVFATGTNGGDIVLWDAREPLVTLCERAGRPMTRGEWFTFTEGLGYDPVCPQL